MKIIILLLLITGCSGPKIKSRFATCPDKPNCVNSFAKDDHFIKPLEYQDSIDSIKKYLESQDRVEIINSDKEYLHAEFTSMIFRFKDDVEFMKMGEIVHIRSASRTGYSDLGANKKRVEQIRKDLEDLK